MALGAPTFLIYSFGVFIDPLSEGLNVGRGAVSLALTIVLQVGGGACLAAGYRERSMAFLLAGLTLMISLFMHDFWNTYEGGNSAHETQNFIKNMAIMAGLLFVAGRPTPGEQR